MADTSFLDSINRERKKRKTRRKFLVGLSVLIISAASIGLVVFHPKTSPKQVVSLASLGTQSGYQYAYLQKICNDDMSKYNSVIGQVNSETNQIGQLIKEPAWSSNTANLIAAQGILTTNQKVLDVASTGEQILQGCLDNVKNEQNFTQAEISDINNITSNIPVASTQSNTVAGVTLPTYSYTPYTLQTTPTDYASSPMSNTPIASTGTTTQPAPTNTTTTPAPPTCNEQLKAEDSSEYQANQTNLGDQESAALSALETKLGQEGIESSGVGQQQISELEQSYTQQSQELQQSYQSQLAAINC
ncbi:MAG TPA: hypothetical protein VMR34_05540 [Candidatus Saccharimonadales bacterium]|nr:hypothetical protein [Candidatus Saccharimonadales bacterium]